MQLLSLYFLLTKLLQISGSRMRTSTQMAVQLTLGLLLLGTLCTTSALDVSADLAKYPQFTKFSELLNSTGVLAEVNTRSSITILLPEDGILNAYMGSNPSYTTQMVADVLRYHCLLSYFGGEELPTLNGGFQTGGIVTTLFQTTGRASGFDGFVNITAQPDGSVTVGPSAPESPIQANIVTNITCDPYIVSYLQVSAVLAPLGLAAAQVAPTAPPTVAPVPSPVTPAPLPVDVPAPASLPGVAPTPGSDDPSDAPAPVVEPPVVETPTITAPASEPAQASEPSQSPVAPASEPAESPVAGSASTSVRSISFGALVASSVFVSTLLF